ncbi:MAB_1171c family putative transporter [Actinokineospora sp. NBRC 105648]|uniref:MAB_1171c family putative transporter n=1 Tax=Actinokineospora sp. NBRC 105648 TaxID=3032206 RepID=UPI002553FD4A|nr:MAB_1171c family putative transporter [Actinokineospora sp. NBRC 105648]
MSAEHLHLVVIVVVLVAFGYKCADLVRAPRPGVWGLCVGLLALAVALVVGYQPVGVLLDRASPGAGWAVQHVVVFAGLLAMQVFYVSSTHAPAARPRAILGRAAVAGAGAVLLLVAWAVARAVESPDWASVRWAEQPLAAGANLVFVAGVAVVLVLSSRLTLRWARIADRPWLRRGLVVFTVGGVLSTVWAVHRIAYIVVAMTGSSLPWDQRYPELSLLALGVCTGVVGITLPAWAPRVVAVRQWVAHYRSYRRLEPLWLALREATPSIELRSSVPWWDMEYRLYRRVIEIWDGRAALRGYLGAASGPAGEAAALRAALAAKRAGTPGGASGGGVREGGLVLADEVAWLERVAVCWGAAVSSPGSAVG